MNKKCAWAFAVLCWLTLDLAASTGESGCHEMRLLWRHRDAAGVRLELVQEAREQIDVAYFIFEDDLSGMAGLWYLREAARRGVQVRLLVDGQWNGLSRSLMHHLIAEGIQVRCYHPFDLHRPLRLYRRMHDKLLIVDRQHLVTGGRNIEDAYFGVGDKTYIDMDIHLRGRVAEEAAGYFDRLWLSDRVEPPGFFRVSARSTEKAKVLLDQLGALVQTFPEEIAALLNGWRSEPVFVDDARFLYDPVGEDRKDPGIRADLLDLVRETREEIVIVSPYLILTPGTRKLLEVGLARGVKVRILTNSLQSTDNLFAQAGYLSMRKRLVGMGVELWEYLGPESLHAKAAVIDGHTTVIGSYNLDPRSERLNTEVAVVLRNPELAALVRSRMDGLLANAQEVDLSHKLKTRESGLPFWGKVKLQMIRLILPLIFNQL